MYMARVGCEIELVNIPGSLCEETRPMSKLSDRGYSHSFRASNDGCEIEEAVMLSVRMVSESTMGKLMNAPANDPCPPSKVIR
jgi:hypothetical protein